MKQIISIGFILAVLVAIFPPFKEVDSESEERISKKLIHTKNGPVQGIVKISRNPSAKFISYLGMRYANPPPRFEPAKPLDETWITPKVAKTPGNICIQPGLGGSDDCLFINVHVPSSKTQDKLPVMFWVHGGAFLFGEGHTYGAEYFMENKDVILVTVNYRLGVFGFT